MGAIAGDSLTPNQVSPMTKYQLQVQINGTGTPINTSWAPRSAKSASALAHYYQRVWPNNIYWLLPIYN